MGKPRLGNTGRSPAESIGRWRATRGSEPSQYPQEKKTIVIPLVAASERGTAQTVVHARRGCRACRAARPASKKPVDESKGLERPAIEGDSPVGDRRLARWTG